MKQLARRALGVFMAMMMLLTTLPSSFALESGSDIKGHWAEEALQSFVDDGYLTGDGRGHYTPDGVMTRAQFAAILNRVTGLTEESSAITGYADVNASDWYYHDLAKALAAGYMSGTSQTSMSPNAAVTRQQAFTMLARYLGLDTSSDAALNGFADEKSVADYARGPIAAMIGAGYVAGTSDKRIEPEKQLTRAEGVTVLYRAKDALKAVSPSAASDLKDGVYTGSGAGYGGTITVQMTVSGGRITKLEVLSHSETNAYYNRAKTLLDTVLAKQGTDGVDTVSGATRSSRGILDAVNACLSQAKGGKDTSTSGSTGGGTSTGGDSTKTDGEDFSGLKDGVYEGEAAGYSGTTKVRVTVSGGKIVSVEIVSHGDTTSYFDRAKTVVDKVIDKQSTDVDTVSGATYSSWGILNAINDALKDAGSDAPVTIEVSTWKELTKALGKAKDGDTIKLTADITDAGQVDAISSATAVINKAVTIDGSGKTISVYDDDTVTKYTTDSDGNLVSMEQVEANFCFDVTTATGITIKDLTIDGASFSSKLGGAMYVETGAELTLDNVTFRNCNAGNSGAGNGGAAFYAEPHRGDAPTVTAKNCTFADNTVNDGTTGRGGAVYGYNANITLENCTFTGNKAGYGGAVAAAGSSKLTVRNCTFGASNDAIYGGDDIYVFDGYTFYKKTMAADSAVTAVLSGNTHAADGSSFKDYRVVCGRVLGDITDTTSAGSAITASCSGSGDLFLTGHDLTFAVTDYERKNAPVKESSGADYAFVLVNIPYADFYKADLSNDTAVDAFTSATKNKTRTASLAGGSYHVSADGSDITGVTFPVVMSKADFETFKSGKTEITDASKVTITVTNRGQTSTSEFTGKEALFESPSYSYYVLSEAPLYYKEAAVAQDGSVSFGKVKGLSAELSGVKVSLQTESSYGDYQLNLKDDSNTISGSTKVYGVILHTEEGSDYGLRHLENIWRGTELAFCTGFTKAVHNCPTSSAHYQAIMGQTITQITYLTDAGAYTIGCNVYVPIKVASSLTVVSSGADVKSADVTLPAGSENYQAVYTVTDASGADVTEAYGFACSGGTLTWTGSPLPGSYTLTLTDGSGKYAPLSGSFTVSTASAAAAYDPAALALKAADGAQQDAFKNYLSNISSVAVDGKSYAASGRGAVQVVNDNGFLDLNASSSGSYVFAELTAGKTYAVTVKSTGYPDLTFTLTVPETLYTYASLTYAEYWASEHVYLSGDDMTASNTTEADRVYTQGGKTYEEHDKGAFDTVTRATTNHGLHRGSFQQSVTIDTKSGKTYQPLYWIDGNNFVDAADGKTYNKSEIGMTQYEITGIKYVPVAVAAGDYRAFCAAYAVTQNGEALLGGYTEGKLKGYSEAAYVTAQTNGLKAAALSDGAWSFGARQTGADSGVLGQAQQTAVNVTTAVTSTSQFGDFIRADITGDGYGALGSRMQTVLWQYYGDGDTVIATYGTKFAADDWMHKSMGVQLGLTESLRCQLPANTDGTGKWIVTVYALGYADFSFELDVTANDIHGANMPMTPDQKAQLETLKDQAAALLASDAGKAGLAANEQKWTVLKEHYDEAVALLANPDATYGDASDLLSELPELIAAVQP